MNKNLLKLNAFTLAEVLITLGIIGVVAAVTMPTLVKNYQKKQTVVQLKKAYTELYHAINIAQKDLGMIEDWNIVDAQTFYEKVFKPNLKIIKYCAPSSNKCWADNSYSLKGIKYRTLNNETAERNSFLTASGYSVFYWLHGNFSGGWLFVDINGPQKPNILGKDIFALTFRYGRTVSVSSPKLGLFPQGLQFAQSIPRENLLSGDYGEMLSESNATVLGGCSSESNNRIGVTCAAIIMLDNWEIKDDYPW